MRRFRGILAFALSVVFLGAQAGWAVVVTKGAIRPDRSGVFVLPLEENADAVTLLESIDRNCSVTEGATMRADDAVVDGRTLTIPFEGTVPPDEVALDCPDWLLTAQGLLPVWALALIGLGAVGGTLGGLYATDVIGGGDDDDDQQFLPSPPPSDEPPPPPPQDDPPPPQPPSSP